MESMPFSVCLITIEKAVKKFPEFEDVILILR